MYSTPKTTCIINERFPNAILVDIISYLPSQEMIGLKEVCNRFNKTLQPNDHSVKIYQPSSDHLHLYPLPLLQQIRSITFINARQIETYGNVLKISCNTNEKLKNNLPNSPFMQLAPNLIKRREQQALIDRDSEPMNLEALKIAFKLETLELPCYTTNSDLQDLKSLTALRSLNLSDCQITDIGLEHLKTLTALHTLDLIGCSITDAGLEHLKTLTALHSLHLNGCQISKAALANIQAWIARNRGDF